MPDEATGKTGVPSPSRQKPERPRDRLGRPLPWGEPSQLSLPDFDALPVEENHALARRFVAEGQYFGAHEAWETSWKQSRGTGDEEFYKGLSQMGAGYVHLLRGNTHGTVTLLGRAIRRIGAYPPGHLGIATDAVVEHCEAHVRAVEDGTLVPGEAATFEPPPV
jgi:hypothetical protein